MDDVTDQSKVDETKIQNKEPEKNTEPEQASATIPQGGTTPSGDATPSGAATPSGDAAPSGAATSQAVASQAGQDQPQPAAAAKKEDSSGARWYIVHAQSGHEKRVVAALHQRIESFGMQDIIQEVLIPTQEKVIISDGKKKTVRERLFPGYVAVKMVLSNETWAVVRNTPGVTGFVGAGAKPTPLSQAESDAILQFTRMEAPKMEVTFKVDETVKIIDGPFADFLGKVDAIDADKGKVRVLVSIFGRETPVELDFLQVSRL